MPRVLAALALLLGCACVAAAAEDATGRRAGFNDGWRFFRGDAPGAERPGFDDSRWRAQRLPHDWAIEGPFDPKLNPHTGALPVSGIGWYRKSFQIPADASGKFFSIEFDGAMANSRVWLNGRELGGRPFGYIGFAFDLTPHLNFGSTRNVLAVRLSPEPESSRWYPGAGIYRNVWLETTGPIHIARWGTFVTTPKISDQRAEVVVRTEVRNRRSGMADARLRTSIVDAEGREVARTEMPFETPAGATRPVEARLAIPEPRRWDIGQPHLYSAISEILENGTTVDRYVTTFGVRTIEFDKTRGFLLNGRRVPLQGVCLHHDLGALGAAVNRRATERQLQIMQAAGVNAIRTSHNPPSPELLDYADRLGMLVIDEAFDVWRIAKVPNDYSKHFAEWSERDVRDMVRRDRNHPSIIMWSIGNEIPEQKEPNGWQEAQRLSRFVREEDPTRPTTSGFNDWEYAIPNKLAENVDIPGFNYEPHYYQTLRERHPDWIIYGSETSSCVSSRGTYHLPLEKYEKHPSLQLSSYDIIAPEWAYCPDVEFAALEAVPSILGEFVWTGFDYIGEPTPYFGWKSDNSRDWPARSSYFGMVDLAGFPKDRFYLYQSRWTRKPMVHVLPHWNWSGRDGQEIPVMAYSNAEEVELLLNGKSLGRKATLSQPIELPAGEKISPATRKFTSKYRLLWQVPYAPGTLTAVARRGGAEVARAEVRTAGPPARIRLLADRPIIRADGDDLAFITVRIEDADGNFAPLADNLVTFQVSGAGEIAAVDNGNAASVESFQAPYRKAFNGLALLIVRSRAERAGRIEIAASGADLAGHSIEIHAER